MKLDTVALILCIAFGVIWTAMFFTGMILASPLGWIGAAFLAVVIFLIVRLAISHLNDRRDRHYDQDFDH